MTTFVKRPEPPIELRTVGQPSRDGIKAVARLLVDVLKQAKQPKPRNWKARTA